MYVCLQEGCPSCHPTNSVKALKAKVVLLYVHRKHGCGDVLGNPRKGQGAPAQYMPIAGTDGHVISVCTTALMQWRTVGLLFARMPIPVFAVADKLDPTLCLKNVTIFVSL